MGIRQNTMGNQTCKILHGEQQDTHVKTPKHDWTSFPLRRVGGQKATMCEYRCREAAKIMSLGSLKLLNHLKYRSSKNMVTLRVFVLFYALYRVRVLMS